MILFQVANRRDEIPVHPVRREAGRFHSFDDRREPRDGGSQQGGRVEPDDGDGDGEQTCGRARIEAERITTADSKKSASLPLFKTINGP